MFESLKIVDILFESLDKKEKKLKYIFNPTFRKENKEWKRHLYFADLKCDFIKEINEFGFSPYLEQTCEQQKNNQYIMKFYKPAFISNMNYIKKLNKSLSYQYINKSSFLNKQKKSIKKKILHNRSNSMSNTTIKPLKDYKDNFLLKIYQKISNPNSNSLSDMKIKGKNTVFMINKDENGEGLLKDYEGCGNDNSFKYDPIKIIKYKYHNEKKKKIKKYIITGKEEKKNDNDIEDQKIIKKEDSTEIIKNTNNSVKKNYWKMTTDVRGLKSSNNNRISSSKIIKKINKDENIYKSFKNIHKIDVNKEKSNKNSKIINFIISNNRKLQNNKKILK